MHTVLGPALRPAGKGGCARVRARQSLHPSLARPGRRWDWVATPLPGPSRSRSFPLPQAMWPALPLQPATAAVTPRRPRGWGAPTRDRWHLPATPKAASPVVLRRRPAQPKRPSVCPERRLLKPLAPRPAPSPRGPRHPVHQPGARQAARSRACRGPRGVWARPLSKRRLQRGRRAIWGHQRPMATGGVVRPCLRDDRASPQRVPARSGRPLPDDGPAVPLTHQPA